MNKTLEYYEKHRFEMVPFLPATYRRVLEVGCGSGQFRTNLTTPCEYTGVEPSSTAANSARAVLDHVYVGTFESATLHLPKRYFDLVICNDVIEHMLDHDAFLEAIKEHMTDDGVLVGSVPNVRYFPNLWRLLINKDWQYLDEGILDRTHLRFFTRKSLLLSLAHHGFRLQKFGGINSLRMGSNPVKSTVLLALASIMGSDSRFLQFAFRVSVIR